MRKGKNKKNICVCIDKNVAKDIQVLYDAKHKHLSTEINGFLLKELKQDKDSVKIPLPYKIGLWIAATEMIVLVYFIFAL
jgi:hypothetical protein